MFFFQHLNKLIYIITKYLLRYTAYKNNECHIYFLTLQLSTIIKIHPFYKGLQALVCMLSLTNAVSIVIFLITIHARTVVILKQWLTCCEFRAWVRLTYIFIWNKNMISAQTHCHLNSNQRYRVTCIAIWNTIQSYRVTHIAIWTQSKAIGLHVLPSDYKAIISGYMHCYLKYKTDVLDETCLSQLRLGNI